MIMLRTHSNMSNNDNILSRGERRLQRDLTEERYNAGLSKSKIIFNSTGRISKFLVQIFINEGVYKDGDFNFEFNLPDNYPFSPPMVRSLSLIYHPKFHPKNGTFALPLIGTDWSPVCTINTIIFAIELLFIEPNTNGLNLNQECADLINSNFDSFSSRVRRSISTSTPTLEFICLKRKQKHLSPVSSEINSYDDEDMDYNEPHLKKYCPPLIQSNSSEVQSKLNNFHFAEMMEP